ncbi:MAG: hypothetical protein J2P15_14175, partial [Micromonosporaceae bacterium]|nr:hypothetical protein [Micromonosporaceae bacterium]
MTISHHDPSTDYQYGQPPPPKSTSGLAIAGLILAFLLAPIGLILSIVGLVQTGGGRRKGRGLAITGLVVSLLITGGATALIVAASGSTLADPGCTTGKDAILTHGSNMTDPQEIQATIDGLNAAAAKATHDNVRAAMKAMADDYTQIQQVLKTGNIPDNLQTKIA